MCSYLRTNIRLGRKEGKRGKRRYRTYKKLKTQAKEIESIEEIDNLVMGGVDLSIMESVSGLEGKKVIKYLKETNQHELWLSHFKERTGREPTLRKKQQRTKTKTTRLLEVDELIEKVATLDEMKKAAGWTSRVAARNYMIRTNQYEQWKAARKKPKLEEQQRQDIIWNIITAATAYLYKKSDRVEQKVFEFFMSARHRRILPEQVRTIYTKYFEAKDAEKKLSLAKLGERLHLCTPEIGRILRDVRLEPLFGKKERHITPLWKKEAIKRAFNLDANPPDIAHFLELPEYIIYQNMKRIGPRPKRQEFIAQPLANIGLPDLTYRLASQIYEARDLKFEPQEIAELLHIKKTIVNYILKNETIISPKILNILKTLYPDKNITTPYIQTIKNN